MRHLLLAFTLLFSTLAFSDTVTKEVAITGIALEAGQTVAVTIGSRPVHLIAFKVKEAISAEDEFTVQLTNVQPGRYSLRVVVRESDLGPVVFQRNATIDVQ